MRGFTGYCMAVGRGGNEDFCGPGGRGVLMLPIPVWPQPVQGGLQTGLPTTFFSISLYVMLGPPAYLPY